MKKNKKYYNSLGNKYLGKSFLYFPGKKPGFFPGMTRRP
ncbi:Uncharacterized protein dnm_004060 [Desulfonema magnum]|uniref:Uncharacterized protein n=1 Tax=Desulfonema magnum TaxID=45655 RepID=A0A975BFM6_9BACT|nr:Uncharacterized protein dnm_004060 [Desulfonema magnum]